MKAYVKGDNTVVDGMGTMVVSFNDYGVSSDVSNIVFKNFYLVKTMPNFKSRWLATKVCLSFIWGGK